MAIQEVSRVVHDRRLPPPLNSQDVGHDACIPHPELFYVPGLSVDAPLLTRYNCADAAKLCELKGEEIVLAELVPKELVSEALDSMAEAIGRSIHDPDEMIFSPVLNGGSWVLNELRKRLNGLITPENTVPIHIQRTYGTSLGDISVRKDFDSRVKDKRVLIVEDLGDQHYTLAKSVEMARAKRAHNVEIAVLTNKVGVPGKICVPEIKFAGFAIPKLWVGGGGADVCDGLCRNYPNIVVKMTRGEWGAFLASK